MTPHWTELRGPLQQWLTTQPRILLGCDFDGTLTPIASHAGDAELPIAVRRCLERLVTLPGVMVAIVSGRALADLRSRVGIRQALYAGNHGLEMLGPGGVEVLAPGAAESPGRLSRALGQLEKLLERVPGVWIEDKRLTASVHYRQAAVDHHALIGEVVNTVLRKEPDLLLRQGKCVWEIRPSITWDKGSAMSVFTGQCGVPCAAVAYFGDDVTDCDAFSAVSGGWPGVVGEMAAAEARLRLCDPKDMAEFLAWVADVRLSAF